MQFERPEGKPSFTAPWFKYFFERLTLPEGTPVRWEPHLLLMTDEFFRPELVHLLVIISKGNWKTTWEAGLADWHMLTAPAPRVYAGAADKEQAKELYGFSAHFIESEPELSARLLVRESTLEIRTIGKRGIYKILASDDSRQGGKKQGKNTTLGLLDEEHAHENDNLKVDLTSGGTKRREAARLAGDPLWWTIGKDVSITTAGHDPDGTLGLARKKFLGDPERGIPPIGTVETGLRVTPDGGVEKHPDGRLTICRSPSGGSVMLEWACKYDPKRPDESDDLDDMAVVKLANPASTVTVESLTDAKELLTPSQFKRYRCCVWTEGYDSWLPETAWSNLYSRDVPRVTHKTWEQTTETGPVTCYAPEEEGAKPKPTEAFSAYIESLYPPGTAIVGALDMARYRDCAAITLVGRPPYAQGRKVPRTIVWKSGGQDNPISYDWPKVAARELMRCYNLLALAMDDKYADQIGDELAGEGVPVESFSQGPARRGPADTELRKEILADNPPEFMHDGDPILAAHIKAGAEAPIGPTMIRIEQQPIPKPPPIDACVALSMANATEKVATVSMYESESASI